jgi:hypothetical protein
MHVVLGAEKSLARARPRGVPAEEEPIVAWRHRDAYGEAGTKSYQLAIVASLGLGDRLPSTDL